MAVAQEAPQHYSLIMDPGLQRPQSALGQRGVMITEYKEARVNPEPIVLEETDLLLEEYLSPRKLRLLTGLENLEEVKYLEMKVDTSETSLGNFGQYLPNLTQLKLGNSIIATVRDLGSCFSKLRVLWMQRCGLHDLDGISSMSNLKELYLAYNEISDISPCGMLDQLKILDLEGNNIDDIAQIEFLSLCSSLSHLSMDGNPVCITPSPDKAAPDYDFRQAVKKCIPNLSYLDDEPLAVTTGGKSELGKKSSSLFSDDWKLINEMMEEVAVGSSDSLDGAGKSRPGTAFRPTTGYRPGSALKRPTTARPLTTANGKRPGSGSRPGTAIKAPDEVVEEQDDGSDLTLGGVVCGNPSKALRAKRKESLKMNTTENPPPLFAQHKFKAEHSYDTILEEENSDMKEIIEELKEWRSEHDKRINQIEESRAPQVLNLSDLISSGEDEPVTDSDDVDPQSDSLDVSSSVEVSSEHIENSLREDYGRKESPNPRPPDQQGAKPKMRRRFRGKSRESVQLRGHDESFKVDDSDDFVRRSSDSASSDLSRSIETPLHSIQTNERSVPVDPVSRSSNGVGERLSSPKRLHSPKAMSRSTEHVKSPAVPLVTSYDENRPHSGPVPATKGIFRLEPRSDKNQPKTIDRTHPIIRAEVHSPQARVPVGPRALTAKAALGASSSPAAPRIRRQLPQVPSLPSKPAMPK